MCDCNHDSIPFEPNQQENLIEYINMEHVKFLNAENGNTCVFLKDNEELIKSDCDDTMILQIPFSSPIKLYEIHFIFSENQSKHCLLFKNRVIDFEDDDSDLTIAQYRSNEQFYPVKQTIFNSTTLLMVYLKDNWLNNDQIELQYIELRGTVVKSIKEPIVAMYEAAANPQDHPSVISTSNKLGFQF